tara:strand:- start:95 stop:544 length:450 start_codon:yes stop_codon:yes gene_type:complete
MVILNGSKIIINNYKNIENIDDLKNFNFSLIDIDLWRYSKKKILTSKNKIGIKINSDQSIDDLFSNLDFFHLIVFNFLSFKDGRPFSHARELRENLNFKKEIRASGYILPDQYIFLKRCGFDTVEVEEGKVKIWTEIYKKNEWLNYQSY